MEIKANAPKITTCLKEVHGTQNHGKNIANEKVNIHNEEERFIKNVKQLTFDGENGEGYFSKDACKIIFQSKRGGNPYYQIYTMDTDGKNQKLISDNIGKTTCGYYHPDGGKIIYASTRHNPSTKKEQLENEPNTAGNFSDKKSKGDYGWDFDPEMDIYEANPDGSNPKRLTTTYGYDAEGTYSNDGKKIVFTSQRDDDLEIYVMNSDGTDQKRLTHAPGYDGGAFFSPDDKEIVFRAFRDPKRPDVAQIYTMDADGKNEKQITNKQGTNWCPYFHPSGKYIIFSSNMDDPANFDLYVVKPDGQGLKQITTDKGFDGLPVFSDDGKKLLWTSGRSGGQSQLFIADWVYDGDK